MWAASSTHEVRSNALARSYRYISSDGHFESPPELWTHRVPAQYRDRAPRRIKLANGNDALITEGRPLTYGGTSLFGGQDPKKYDPAVMDYDSTPGCGDAAQRLREQDRDGIDAEVLYALSVRNPSIRDKAAFMAIIKGFNDYFAEEYCSLDPDRLIGVAVLPNKGVEDDIAEMTRCKKMGYKTAWMAGFPSGNTYPSEEDDRFWAAAVDLNMPLVIHTSFPRHYAGREVSLMKYPLSLPGEEAPPTDYVERMGRHGIPHSGAIDSSLFVMSGVFDRFPKLKINWAENNIGWIPYFLEQMDKAFDVNRYWAERQLGLKPPKRRPSEYLKENAYWGFFDDPIGVKLRDEIGVNHIMWSTDFPHIVTRWPDSIKVWDAQSQGVPEHDKWMMVAGTAIDFFQLDHVEATS
jgi:predicted TIM-barrel fold metal-dependent hydrolase